MENELEINGKKIVIGKVKYATIVELQDLEKESEKIKRLFLDSTGMTEEEYNNLDFKEGQEIQAKILEVNNLVNFQAPLESRAN